MLNYLLILCLTSLRSKVIVSMPTCTISRSPLFLFFIFYFFWLSIVFFTPAVPYEDVLIRQGCWIPAFMLLPFVLLLTCWVMTWLHLVRTGEVHSPLHESGLGWPYCLFNSQAYCAFNFWCGIIFLHRGVIWWDIAIPLLNNMSSPENVYWLLS